MNKPINRIFMAVMALILASVACNLGDVGPALPLRSDMPTQGLDSVVTYKLTGPAGTEKEVNVAEMRGVNDFSPMLQQQTIFGKLSGSKTQDVLVTLPDGRPVRALGMNKIKRFAGLTRFMTLEPATYETTDVFGNHLCGIKVRLDFNRNVAQLLLNQGDFDYDSLWYYDAECLVQPDGSVKIDIDHAHLRAVVFDEVWQLRITSGSFFYNWGHSVTIVPGTALTGIAPRWWEKFDFPNTDNDAMGAARLMNAVVADLSTSPQPWLEFANPAFADSYLIYSAGDADQYATWNRALLNRQNQYAVLYRPSREVAWDGIIVNPVYNYEWNDVQQTLAKFHGWTGDLLNGHLNERGLPKDPADPVISEIERIGWMNGPNASLSQIQFISVNDGTILYTMTVRAYVGAKDTLVMFGPGHPVLASARDGATTTGSDQIGYPWAYDDKGNPVVNPAFSQEQWTQLQQEGSMWNYLKGGNPFGTDLFVQYRFSDDSTWKPVYCSDSDGNSWICGWNPVEWNLDSTYFFQGDVNKPWLISQLLGEVGVRTLGMSYNSCLYCGTGMLFAMVQKRFNQQFYTGFTQESIWMFDARASQLPDTLSQAWAALPRP